MIRLKRLSSWMIAIVLLSLPFIIWWQRWNVYDYFRLRNYQPSQQIIEIATQTTMTAYARHILYVFHPELDDKSEFNAHCKNSERTIVLGCYVSGTGIYIYNVTETRLQGVLQVTAAHEMLHAAYGRLSSGEKFRVNSLLNQAYGGVVDPRIHETIADYKKNGADVTNELHSILGTEVRKLPADLEQYYSRYFQSRQAVVDYSDAYEKAFDERKQQVMDADKRLQTLKQQVEQAEGNLTDQKTALDAKRTRLDELLAAKNYEAYNSNVPGFNAQVAAYNSQVGHIRSLIEQYNKLVAERNAIAIEEGELVNAIDSRPETLQGQ